jgi:hypothetical protein
MQNKGDFKQGRTNTTEIYTHITQKGWNRSKSLIGDLKI